jgi:hypothetical protein
MRCPSWGRQVQARNVGGIYPHFASNPNAIATLEGEHTVAIVVNESPIVARFYPLLHRDEVAIVASVDFKATVLERFFKALLVFR